ncbi:hypothetical protein ES703_72000 [subsurface metagenome]
MDQASQNTMDKERSREIQKKRIVNYEANYTQFCNFTRKGYLNIDIDIDVFKVDVDYGGSAKLIWMALKKGYYEWDYYADTSGYSYEYIEENHQIIDREIKKYDWDTMELIDAWNVTEEIYDTINCSGTGSEMSGMHLKLNTTFTMPFFLVFQLYTTEKGDNIAWASTFSEFLVFNDKNMDGIFTIAYSEMPHYYGPLNLYTGTEWWGRLKPIAEEYEGSLESPSLNYTTDGRFPSDRTVDEIASSIKFTPPSLVGNDTVVWDIDYKGFPIDMVIGRNEIPSEEYITDDTSPNDFSYGFDYKIGGGQADLSLTLGLPDITHLDDYGILEKYNLGICLPKYNYFLSSFDINERNPKDLTIPSDIFSFESNNETVAEINLVNPLKRNYTLYDYPSTGETITAESGGANINNIVTLSNSYFGHLNLPELNFLYTIEDLAKTVPGFTVVDNLYHVHTENYPVWAGKKLVHDPTNTIYFEDITLPFRVAADSITGFDIVIISSSVSFVVLVITLKRKKFKKK